MKRLGRESMFGAKDGGARVQGTLTKVGTAAFERARGELLEMWNRCHPERKRKQASDGDTFEFLARGPADTIKYFRAHP